MTIYYYANVGNDHAEWIANNAGQPGELPKGMQNIGGGWVQFTAGDLHELRTFSPDDDCSITEAGVEGGVAHPIQMWIGGLGYEVTTIDPNEPVNAVRQADAEVAVVVELYRGEAPGSIGTLLEAWDGQLDADTWEWLTGEGYGTEDPDLWVNIVPVGTWAPNNHPLTERTMRIG